MVRAVVAGLPLAQVAVPATAKHGIWSPCRRALNVRFFGGVGFPGLCKPLWSLCPPKVRRTHFTLALCGPFHYHPPPILRESLDKVRAFMGGSLRKIGLAVIVMVLAAGCTSSPWSAARGTGGDPALPPDRDQSFQQPAPAQPGAEAQAMQAVMAELQQLGALDSAAQDKLMADLRQTDPALWPLVLRQFRAAAAYRRRAQQAEMAGAGPYHVAAAGPIAGDPGRQPPPGTYPPQQVPWPLGESAARIDRLPVTSDAALAPMRAPEGNYPRTEYQPAGVQSADRPQEDRQGYGPAGRVINASYDPAAGDWQAHLASATRVLESRLQGAPETPGEVAQHAQLRMLYLLAGRRDDAVRPIPAIAPATQEFWSKELFGLATWLDAEATPDATTRAVEAKQLLAEAVTRLGESAPLAVRNLAFCTKIHSYGCTEPFSKYEFAPDQEVLLYAEVENFATESTPKGFHTSLRSSYQIFDSRGQRVADHDFTTTEEYCQNPRRDFFIGYHLRLPKRIYPGKHTLQLTIEDLKSRKLGQSSIELTIKETED